jgi:hypothetical protein
MLALLIESFCDRNQEQKGKFTVGKSAVLTIIIPNSSPYILKGELKGWYVFIIKKLDNIREEKLRECKIFKLKSRNTQVYRETHVQKNI